MPDARCANQSNFVRSSQDKKAKFFGVKAPGRKNRNWSSYSIDRVSDEMLDTARKQNFHILCSHYLDWNWFYRDILTWNRNFLVTAASLKQVLSGWLFWYVYLLPIRNNFIDERWMAILHICQHSALFLLFRDSFLSVAIWKWISPPGFSHTRLFHLGRMPLRSFHALPSPERSPGKEANNGSVRAELH